MSSPTESVAPARRPRRLAPLVGAAGLALGTLLGTQLEGVSPEGLAPPADFSACQALSLSFPTENVDGVVQYVDVWMCPAQNQPAPEETD